MLTVFETARTVGITELLHGYAEGPVLVLFALLTQLGDVWFLFLLASVLYITGTELPRWEVDRCRGLFVIGLVITYVALIGALKAVFELPRPPGAGAPPAIEWLPPALMAVIDGITTAEGPGFPSGHAMGSTMVWGGVALVLDEESDRLRFGIAGVAVAVISTSRLVLGVHYAVDIVAGFAVGLVVLGALYWITDRGTQPGRALVAGVAVGAVGLAVHVTYDSVAAIGSAVGAWLVWVGVAEVTPIHPDSRREIVGAALVLVAAGVLFGAVYALEPPYPVTFLGAALTAGGAVAAPVLGDRLI